ncbi:MAG TPA: EamA family transporter [Candidatus Limnocylindria bacterium]|nr:EamA family transporter [Candidatus Limnocylindria bacterium]
MASSDGRAPAWLIWSALLVVYVVWGSTYLAIRLVVETMPPLLSGSARFLVAGALIYAVLLLRHGPRFLRLSRTELAGSTFVGLALLLGGNGLVMLGERDVPSGLAALIIAVVPLWVVLLRMVFGEHVQRGTLLGVLVGFAGVAVLVLPRGASGSVALEGMLMLVVAGASWAVGSYYSRRVALPRDPFVSTAAQLVLGGAGLAVAGLLSGELGLLRPERFSTESVVSLLYLVFFGSILAYTAYTWLLQVTSVSRVSTYAYVNPVVALLLGWAVLNEEIGLSMLLGGAMIVIAVGLVIRTEARPGRDGRDVGALEAPPAQAALPGQSQDAPAPSPER